MTYKEIAEGLEDENRRNIALDLAEKLDKLNESMKAADIDKTYQSNMRLYLQAQKQFSCLLPPNKTGEAADALTEFNQVTLY